MRVPSFYTGSNVHYKRAFKLTNYLKGLTRSEMCITQGVVRGPWCAGDDRAFTLTNYLSGVCDSLICSRINSRTVANSSRTVREQVFASSPRKTLLFAQSLVRELVREQFANKPSLLCLGIFTKLAYFGGYSEKYPVFQQISRGYFATFV